MIAGGVPRAGAEITASPASPGDAGPADAAAVGGDRPRSARTTPQDVYASWAATTSASTGVPARALAAYAAAQARLDREQPGCRLTWPTLAGVGQIESGNGAHGGGLRSDGRPREPILGVALDGRGDVAAVADTDDGALDGDVAGDRAVGPLQFLPSSWEAWGADGDRDGSADPQDIDDAALAAGRYLCAAGDLSTGEGWTAAVLSYNHSREYVDTVAAASRAIAERSLP